jgi:biotin carboxylase
MAETLRSLRYPLVVKPCRGITSENVKKVTDENSMRKAVRMAFREGFPNPAIALVLLETYVDGPEFDANFMLWDGDICFLEVTDNFPCPADASNATVADAFRETVQISNSALPQEEIELIRSSLHRHILGLGFRSGVFHAEGRMQNSSMKYLDTCGNGIVDLHLNPNIAVEHCGKPDVFLVEINVRPPGTGGTWATLFAYGVDQGALHFLHAVEDAERFAALSHPFDFPSGSAGGGSGTQFWTAQCLVPIHRDNIRVPGDLWERLYHELPEIEPHVLRAEMYAEPGTVVSIIRGIGWIGYVLLYSNVSRRHVLELYHRLARTCVKLLNEDLE